MEYLTSVEIAEKWGISSRRVALLCSEGRVEGSIKKGKTWLIPDNTEKPIDPRKARKMNNSTKSKVEGNTKE